MILHNLLALKANKLNFSRNLLQSNLREIGRPVVCDLVANLGQFLDCLKLKTSNDAECMRVFCEHCQSQITLFSEELLRRTIAGKALQNC